jgi:uncharacterized protein
MKLKTLLLSLLLSTSLIDSSFAAMYDDKTKLEELTKYAEDGHANSQYKLGHAYSVGIGVIPKDDELSVKWYTKSAEQGHSASQFALGEIYSLGQLTPKDSKKAFKWYLKAAEQDDRFSQYIVAGNYRTLKDYKEAFRWYHVVSEGYTTYQGHHLPILAKLYIGQMHHFGEGVPKDDREAINWYKKAIEQEDELKNESGWSKPSNATLSRIDDAIMRVQFFIAISYDFGEDGVQDKRKAFKWYLKAAEQGHSSAQYNIGNMYNQGDGTLKNNTQAFKWWKMSAEQGDASAQNNLGWAYGNGKGVVKNLSKSRFWVDKAYNNPSATNRVIELAKKNWDKLELWKYKDTAVSKKNKAEVGTSKLERFGTGFRVDKSGTILTNNHVIEGCSIIKIDDNKVDVKSTDASNDLALLQGKPSASVAYFRSGVGVRLGEDITITGYPLRGVFGDGLNAVTGTISSLSGIRNNTTQFQITAPLNSGNSGGPVLDSSGNIVGVVVSKINNIKAKKLLGEEISGASFAIKSSVVRNFLDIGNVDYDVRKSNKKMSNSDIVAKAKRFTVLVKCWE